VLEYKSMSRGALVLNPLAGKAISNPAGVGAIERPPEAVTVEQRRVWVRRQIRQAERPRQDLSSTLVPAVLEQIEGYDERVAAPRVGVREVGHGPPSRRSGRRATGRCFASGATNQGKAPREDRRRTCVP
jgi:hypothetical protein